MTQFNYGLSERPPDPAMLREIVAANSQLLGQTGYDAGLAVLWALGANEAQLDLVRDRLKRSLAGSSSANTRRLSQVREALTGQLAGLTSASGAQLASVPAGNPGPAVLEPLPAQPVTGSCPGLLSGSCWYVPDPQLKICEAYYLPQGPLPADVGGDLVIYNVGPFGSREDALAYLAARGVPCTLPPPPPPEPPPEPITCPTCCCCPCSCPSAVKRPPPPPPPPPEPITPQPQPTPRPATVPDLPPLATCVLRPDGTFPEVGSPEWCACLNELRQWFANLGTALGDFLFVTATAPLESTSWLAGAASALLGTIGFDFPGANLIKALADSILQRMRDTWGFLRAAVTGAPLCNPLELLGIALARALIDALKHVKFGIEIPMVATVELAITVPQLEEILNYVSNHACPVEVPSPAEAIECLLQNTATEQQVRCWLAMRGVSLDVWRPVVEAQREKLSIDELIRYLRRQGETDTVIVGDLLRRGFTRPDEAVARVDLFDEMPSIADFLHFLVRNVFDKEYVHDYGLMEGFDERFWREYGPALRAIGMTEKWAREHYAAHWINPAPTQMQEFVYRLRPDKEGVANPFTQEDYRRLLAEQDVAPFAAKRFQETLYRIPALSYLRDMYRQFIISDDELRSYHQDLGFTEADSEKFVRVDRVQRDRLRATQGHGWDPAALARAFSSGALNQEKVSERMDALGFHQAEADDLMARAQADVRYTIVTGARSRVLSEAARAVRNAQLAGVLDVNTATGHLQRLGYPEEMARGVALATAGVMGVDLVKKATARVKRALLSGAVTADYARAALAQLGIDGGAIVQFLLAWSVENTPNRKRRTAGQITHDVASGQMDTTEALARLANLGYPDADSRLFLADAARQITGRQAKLLAAGQRNERARAAALQKAQQTARRQAAKLQTELRRLSPLQKLQGWVKKGIIGRNFFFARGQAIGYDLPDLERYYEEACARKGAVCETTPPEQEHAPAGGAGGA